MNKYNYIVLILCVLVILVVWWYAEEGISEKQEQNLSDLYNWGSIIPQTQGTTIVYGCTDPVNTANYNQLATIDNGTCYTIAGCCDTQATNYDPTADSCNIPDNNSILCEYS